jgi:hypothetical protein
MKYGTVIALIAAFATAFITRAAAEPAIQPNLAMRRVSEAPDLAPLYDLALKGKLSADEKLYLGQQLRDCAAWRGAGHHPNDRRSTTFDPANMTPGKRRDAAIAVRKRCTQLVIATSELVAESGRLQAEALRERSMIAIAMSLPNLVKTNHLKAADLAIEVLESGNANAVRNLILYLNADEAFARMRDDPYVYMKSWGPAWETHICAHGADCAASPYELNNLCIFWDRCEGSSNLETQLAALSAKDRKEVDRYVKLIDDIFSRKQWDRLGIRASRYPWVEKTNSLPPRPHGGK